MSFVNAINAIPTITGELKSGLKAMGQNSSLVHPKDPRKCEGSVDIDACFCKAQPHAHRWDYVIGYGGHAYFIEVHPATGQVSDVIAKATWLRSWLKAGGSPLATIHGDGVFHWISTGSVNIIGKERKRLAANKIVINSLKLL